MNVVVTGGAGYEGSALVARLVERGHYVRVLDEFADGDGSLDGVMDRVELIHTDPGRIEPRWLRDADAVVHLAGLCESSCRRADVGANWTAHAVATERLASACRAMKIPRLTYASTWEVYATLPAGYEYDEEVRVQPRTPLAVSKYYAERRLLQAADGVFCPTILRHAVPYGISPRPVFETAPNRFVLEAVASGRVALPEDAWIARPFVDVADLAEAHVRCLEAPAARVSRQVFNVVHASMRLREVGSLVADIVGRRGGFVRITKAETIDGGRDCRCTARKLREILGFAALQTLETAADAMACHLTAGAAGLSRSVVMTAPHCSIGCASPDTRSASNGGVSGCYRCWG